MMPRSEQIAAAKAVVSEASAALTLDLVEELAEPLAESWSPTTTPMIGRAARLWRA